MFLCNVGGEILAFDDTHTAHPYATEIPLLYWLYDSPSKTFTWVMNIVALHAVRGESISID